MSSEIDRNYDAFYAQRDPEYVYPVEFVVRAFLGNYPRLARQQASYRGQTALDLGFGDGRNIPLMANLGLTVSGVEIADEICQRTKARLSRLGVDADLRTGRNCSIPFADSSFDHLLACHACYYIDPGTQFTDNIAEIARVLKPGGRFVFSAPIGSSYIMRGARDLGDGHMKIANDPYGIRNGYVLKKFDSEAEILAALAPHFDDARIGACRNDFWGIEEHVWTVVCWRNR